MNIRIDCVLIDTLGLIEQSVSGNQHEVGPFIPLTGISASTDLPRQSSESRSRTQNSLGIGLTNR